MFAVKKRLIKFVRFVKQFGSKYAIPLLFRKNVDCDSHDDSLLTPTKAFIVVLL